MPLILVCPLNWGLGHATRCVPVIRSLIAMNCSVLIAGDGCSLDFLKQEFPECSFVQLPSYRFFYSRKNRMAEAILCSAPMILWGIFIEHFRLRKIIRQYGIQGIISDNRFGLWSKKISCVYITHQLKIKTQPKLRFLESLLHKIHRYFIGKYDFLLIPDYEDSPTLSGDLAHHFDINIKHWYIGPLSRFAGTMHTKAEMNDSDYADILVIISGPEPQRSIFENIIVRQAATANEKIILLKGIPGKNPAPQTIKNLTIYPHVETNHLKMMIAKAGIVLCRSGYSSIMDLAVTGKKAFFVPTPGQTEQEYLAEYLRGQGIANYATQDVFKLADVLSLSAGYSGFSNFKSLNLVEEFLKNFITQICNKR